ncbi:MAG: undecaprenyl-diphosphate phosphatase [Pseudomonadota bacterium]
MVPLYQIIILSLIQGITEFLPISSSAHLIFFPKVFGWQDQGLVLDVAVHFGTLGAVMVYFWRDCWSMTTGSLNLLRGKVTPGGELFMKLVVATIPAVVVGAIISYYTDSFLRNVTVIAWASIGFGIILYLFDRFAPTKFSLKHMNFTRSFIIGLIQVLAFIPGTSRSGSTIMAARMLGFNRVEAAHFACLMSIPLIIAAACETLYKLAKNGNHHMYKEAMIAAGISFVISLGSIGFMMMWVKRASYGIFVVYRVLLGVGLLAWVYTTG